MNSPSEQLLNGALLGDVVQSLTGQDVIVERSHAKLALLPGRSVVRCTHTSRTYAGHILVGTARVVWEGVPEGYAKLLNARMKDYLRANRVRPVNEAFDDKNERLFRRFTVKSSNGTLRINETLFLKEIHVLSCEAHGTN